MPENELKVTGTLIWYYYICQREVWLMARNLVPDQDNQNVDLGRFIQENSYRRDKKEIRFGHVSFDIVRKRKDGLVIGEIKKSSHFLESSRMQLAFYLLELEKAGITAKGELNFPKEKKKEIIELNDDLRKKLDLAVRDILRLAYLENPPKPRKCRWCKNCAYGEFCWS